MKPILILALAAIGLMAGCNSQPKELTWDEMGSEQHLDRWRELAMPALLQTCTNEICGFSRLIDAGLIDDGGSPVRWSARPTIEFINHVGGVDRTNIICKFSAGANWIICNRDEITEYHEAIERLQAKTEK